ncbi:fungal-specific transcription factor domain-containing protein [Trichoderma barbatum]
MGLRPSGCWTCRIRHRKCDSNTPTCKECTDRNVQCHGYGERPEWMDGAAEEEKEKLKIKNAVKENFRSLRRMQNRARQTRRAVAPQPQAVQSHEEGDWEPGESICPPHGGNLFVLEADNIDSMSIHSNKESNSTIGNLQSAHKELTLQEPRRMPWIDSHDAGLLMHYLDQVFSWQFPYHSYTFRSGNRGWLLSLLIQQGPLYHAILSLSSLHQSALLGREEEYCQQSIAFDRHSRALRELCAFMSCEDDQLSNDAARMTEFLSSSIMLITFEVFRGGENDWQLHLNAVTSILSHPSTEKRLIPQDRRDNSQWGQMHDYLDFTDNKDRHGLQFLITAALWFDILSCVSTGKAPALPYSQWLSIPGLDTAAVMGCQNWIMALIGDLAHLGQWKVNSIKVGLLSTRELAMKGQEIESALENGLAHLNLNKNGLTDREINVFWVSRMFALAALVLLHTIVSGPLPKLPEIQSAVSRIIATLGTRPKSCPVNGIVWAMCIAGSMAEPAVQQSFENCMKEMLDDHGRFGNCSTVLRIMRKCWGLQKHGVADCRAAMSEMGICALLI